MKAKILRWLKSHQKLLKWVSIFLNIFAAVTLILWLFKINGKFANWDVEWEAAFVLLTTTAILIGQFYKWLLKEAQYSPAYALAYGYVNNFLEQLIIQLIENGEKKPTIYIYKPEDISELFSSSIDRVKGEIKNKNFQINEIKLSIKHGRARDILIVEKSKTKKIYFDFPNTLTSLVDYIGYAVESKANESPETEKKKMTKELIEVFFGKVNELLKEKRLDSYVIYCDHKLEINF